ncbi:MAG TPA: C4-type zinc ribbon domain-containing protein [Cyclobacteriaceae bacterium]|nr:C4-type zinc ribbon domain-containing protein [Cyclobacteriaceae bacterium]
MMETTIAQRLEALSKLQSIDSKLDEIAMIRGALPYEVMDLEDEIAGYQTRITKIESEVQEVENSITHTKDAIKSAEKLIQKYTEQQMNVRNNREYDAITKEIELQQLEIQICEKRIKEGYAALEGKKEMINNTKATLDERKKDLDSKKQELDVISSESQEEEQKLIKSREKAAKTIEDRLIKSYTKIRNNAKNKLAVVSVKRGACGGCFNVVPPQRQAEVREKKKLIVCEHCGRILADVEEVVEEVEKEKRKKKTVKK